MITKTKIVKYLIRVLLFSIIFHVGLGLFGRIDEYPIFILNPLMWQPNYFFGGEFGGEKGGFPVIFKGTITIK